MFVGYVDIKVGDILILRNGEKLVVVDKPWKTSTGNYFVSTDGDNKSLLREYTWRQGYWSVYYGNNTHDEDQDIVDVIVSKNHQGYSNYEPSCHCSFKMADSTEKSWPHSADCAFYLNKRGQLC